MVNIPKALNDRAIALGFRFVTDKVVNFAYPRGEDVLYLETPWGREPVFYVATVESFIAGCEDAQKDTV